MDERADFETHSAYMYGQGLFEYSEQVVRSIMAPLQREECSAYTPDVARWAAAQALLQPPAGPPCNPAACTAGVAAACAARAPV